MNDDEQSREVDGNEVFRSLAPLALEELARRHVSDFLQLLICDYAKARHSELLCDYLEKLERREIRRLIVLEPPRYGKSLHVSQALPAWYLGRHPRDDVILASYAGELAQRNSRYVRNLVLDSRYPFPVGVSRSSSSVHRWHTTQGGAVIAAGVGGALTGFGANLAIIDDPVKDRVEADSQIVRDMVWKWYTDVLQTRLTPDGVIVLVMTRWHEDDLAGRILASRGASDWTVLKLPALAEENDPLGRKKGEPLWPERFPLKMIPSVDRGQIDQRSFDALYQQRPTSETGGLIKMDWLDRRYSVLPDRLYIVQAVDTAFKITGTANFSVIATWGTDGECFYLIDIWRQRVEYPELLDAVRAKVREFRPGAVYVEDAGPGQSLIQTLKRERNMPIIKYHPKWPKDVRLAHVSRHFQAGTVMVPARAPWLEDWIEEHIKFPLGRFDDQVDTTSMALDKIDMSVWPQFRSAVAD